MDSWIQYTLEIVIALAVGGLLVSAIRLLRRGRIKPQRCRSCHKPLSRAYPGCRWCGTARPESAHGWTSSPP